MIRMFKQMCFRVPDMLKKQFPYGFTSDRKKQLPKGTVSNQGLTKQLSISVSSARNRVAIRSVYF